MVQMLPIVMDMLIRPETHKVMSTVSVDGQPHSIVCGSLIVIDPETIAVGEVNMYTTCKNLETNRKVEFLAWLGREAYGIQAEAVGRITEGPILEKMNQRLNKMNMVAYELWAFRVCSVYDEGVGDLAGTRII